MASGKAACLAPASMIAEGSADLVRFVPVEGLAPSRLAVVWKGRASADSVRFEPAARSLVRGG